MGSATASVAHARDSVPFAATIDIVESVTPGTTCPLQGQISGEGTLSIGVGKASRPTPVTASSTDCIIPANAEMTSFVFLSNNVVFTTRSGDQITAAYSGTLTVIDTMGNSTIRGGFWITGGTGAFSKAVGAGTVQGFETINLAAGSGTGKVQLTGTIMY